MLELISDLLVNEYLFGFWSTYSRFNDKMYGKLTPLVIKGLMTIISAGRGSNFVMLTKGAIYKMSR